MISPERILSNCPSTRMNLINAAYNLSVSNNFLEALPSEAGYKVKELERHLD